MNHRCVAVMILGLVAGLQAQFGPPPPQGHGPTLAAPTAFPASGTFPTTESVTLLDADAGATIHYTLDGSVPTAQSPAYDPAKLIFLTGFYDGDHGIRAGYTLRAVAIEDGHTNSPVSDFEYTIARRDRTAYVSEQILPGVRMIRDSDNDKMFLTCGTKECVLIDSGMGRGALRDYVAPFTRGLPLAVIFTHNHGDHIGQADQFIRTSTETIGTADRAGLVRLLHSRGVPDSVIDQHVIAAHNGDRVDLGGRTLELYDAPGHTPGSIVIYDPAHGYLFSGDAFGSNSPTIPDALWMQFTRTPLDDYWAMIKRVRAELGPGVRDVMTGHNDRPLAGGSYLDNLETALRRLMDEGDAALVPSYRPLGLRQVIVGDRFHDPNWVAINVNLASYLPAPVDKIDSLVGLAVSGATLQPSFTPEVKQYTAALPSRMAAAGGADVEVTVAPTSSRSTVKINGVAAHAGANPVPVSSAGIEVEVTSPHATQSATYTVNLKKERP